MLAGCAPATPTVSAPEGSVARAPDGGAASNDADASIPTATPFRSELVPNRWERLRDDLPSSAWETGIAYEPRLGALVQHGGHLPGSYVQSPYTLRYEIRRDTFVDSLAPVRPMRRCIVELAWLSGPARIATVQGAASHGSLPPGTLRGWRVTRSDARGPWLYDALADRWEHTRPTGTEWPLRQHAGIVYDETSDAMYVVGGDGLYAYVPHANRVLRLPMPAALSRRFGYAIAFDPDSRRLAIFGGASRHWTYGHIDGDETDNCGVVDTETCASYYREYVASDTWILDVDDAARAGWPPADGDAVPAGWHKLEGPGPPRGMPMWDHQRLQLTWHAPSGRMLLLQHAIDEAPNMDPRTWPSIDLWALDAGSETWTRIDTDAPPHFAGLSAYAEGEDVLFAWGGGERGDAAASDTRATTNRVLYAMRPRVPGAPSRVPPSVARVSSLVLDAARVELRFPATPGRTYEIARAPATPMAGAYEVVARVTADRDEVTHVDVAGDAGAHAYRAREEGTLRWSLPAFDVPARPSGLRAITRSANQVELTWDAPPSDVAEVRLHRFGPSEGRHVIGSSPPGARSYVDREVDLGDGLARVYVATFVDAAGRESGASPMAYTVPDAPEALSVEELVDGSFEVRWVPRDATERLALFYLDYHCNARSSIEAYLDAFTPVDGPSLEGGTARVRAPVLDPVLRNRAPESEPGECGRTLREGHYFYGRVIGALDQPGLYSDIVSPRDPRFRAAVPERH